MRTGNLPANMKKNRVLQIIPCEWCAVSLSPAQCTWWNCRFPQPRLMFLFVPDRWVQQSDHSSQTRRGEHRLRERLFHWCECKSIGIRADRFNSLNASHRSGVVKPSFSPPAVYFVTYILLRSFPHRATVRRTRTWRARAPCSTL